MKRFPIPAAAVGLLLAAAPTIAAERPANATGQCNDGSYTTQATRADACARQKGVKSWYAEKAPVESVQPTENRAPDKPTQSINSAVSGDRKNNTQPTDRR